MCGICGRVTLPGKAHPDAARHVSTMALQLAHRGPDDTGFWNDDHASLGHRRLSIIDLSPDGHQPMVSEDGSTVLIFNGEIYNYRELRARFQSEISFRFNNDSEVILRLYEKTGTDCVQYLRGMFAFAIWDARKRRLFFARDRAGKKPFYYSFQNGAFAFASELHALRVNPDFEFVINEEALYHFLSLQYIPSPITIYRNVFKLPPASFGIFSNGAVTVQRYWKPDYREEPWNEQDALARLDELLRESVRLRMISDVPLGAFLSGGIDSSAVVALMSRISSQPVKTFSISFAEQQFNEAPFAREIANHCHTEHQEFEVTPNYVDVLPDLLRHYSEPYADPSAIPVYYLARMTRSHVTVALNGDGGDELFGGYERYRIPANPASSMLAPLVPAARLIPPNLRYLWRIRRHVEDHAVDPQHNYIQKICFFTEEEKRQLLTMDFAERCSGMSTLEWFADQFRPFRQLSFPQKLMSVDIETYLPDDLLVKVDIATMSCSLESRSPFLDHELLEFAATLPADLKIRNGISKYLLKRYLRDKIPPAILARPKMGFGVPLAFWFRRSLRDFVRETLLSSPADRGYFRRSKIERLIRRHESGAFDNSYKLYALLTLELWHRIFIDQNPVKGST